VPRFDNRIISKCKLIPRLNVCKADKVLNKEVTFLLTLKDMRYTLGQISSKSLSHEEIKYLFEKYKNNLRTDEQKKEKLITAKNWKEYIQSKDGKINPNQKEIPQRKLSGRSRFCKPALNILHGLILSGKKPHDYYKELVDQSKNVNPSKGLVKDDYKFLLAMPNDWNSISIQDTREDDKKLTREQSLEKIDKIIGSISNRIVRHRLLILKSELEKLDKRFGKPEKIIFEIAREDFIGEKKKTEYKSFQNDNKKEITNARKLLENKKICINDMNILRARLYERQKSIDIYDTSENRNIVISKLDQYEIDHIVPRRKGGSDSMVNYILTKREFNQDKEGSTPYEWFHKKRAGDWDSYLKNVDEIFCKDKNNKNKNKVNLLISDKAIELNSRKTDLQATSYIEKDAQYLSSLYFGWGLNTKDDKKKILFYTGAETASVRKNLELNRILFADPDLTDEEYKKTKQSDDFKDKNRKNERHHALDALVLSVLPEIKLNFKKVEEKPDFFNKEFCEKEINKVYPKTIKQVTPKLRETIYGLRWRLEKDEKTNKVEKKYYFVSRYKSFIDNFKLLKSAKKGKIFDLKIKEKLNEENLTQEKWEEFLKDYKDDYKGIKKIAIIDYPPKAFKKSEVFNSDDAINNVIGEYGDKGAIKGQWIKRKKSHQGQIVYKDEKDKWIVVPIYAFESVYLKRKEYTDKYKEKVKFFKSGQLVEIKENYKNKKGKDIEKGVYKLRTLRINGDCEIENLNNQKTLKKKIGIFLEQCGMIPYEKQ
jgi:CRISPR-associated endonuclease Csn1